MATDETGDAKADLMGDGLSDKERERLQQTLSDSDIQSSQADQSEEA